MTQIRTMLKGLGIMAAAKAVSFYKVSFVLGSFYTFFSLSSCVLPLTGAALNPLALITLFMGQCALRALFGFGFSAKLLSLYIPGMIASLYWSRRSALLACSISLVSMILFCIHPVGSQAFLYSFYWFIPMVLSIVARKNIMSTAVTSTFLAHAVGSVIWLYACPMTPAVWMGLIPVVLAERLLFASGMVFFYYSTMSLIAFLKTMKTRLLSARA